MFLLQGPEYTPTSKNLKAFFLHNNNTNTSVVVGVALSYNFAFGSNEQHPFLTRRDRKD